MCSNKTRCDSHPFCSHAALESALFARGTGLFVSLPLFLSPGLINDATALHEINSESPTTMSTIDAYFSGHTLPVEQLIHLYLLDHHGDVSIAAVIIPA